MRVHDPQGPMRRARVVEARSGQPFRGRILRDYAATRIQRFVDLAERNRRAGALENPRLAGAFVPRVGGGADQLRDLGPVRLFHPPKPKTVRHACIVTSTSDLSNHTRIGKWQTASATQVFSRM